MQITRATDYAVRVMIHLAGLPPGSTVRQSELSKATDVSGHFLSKVLQQLVRSGLIRSQRGSGGGYVLALAPNSVSLLDVVEAMEGPVRLNQCLEEGPSCDKKSWCPAHQVWAEAQAAVGNVLGSASIASLAAQAKANLAGLYRLHERPIWISGVPRKNRGKGIRRTHGG
ncbi:MAG TPA: Rrf2 family transcriptional regulator [Candidatus Sulfotelmatobacter sp.]|nr:Rrf2 family transcriptional regulator [Candidatus Sulfotelmatobacter sp.]